MRRIRTSSSPLAAILLLVAAACWVAAVELPPAMVESLKSEKFADRETAEADLLAWSRERPAEAMEELYRQSRVAPDPEVRERCFDVLRGLVNDEYLRNGVGYLGVMMNPMVEPVNVAGENQPRFAIRLIHVEAETPAKKAGLVVGDLLLGVNDTAWRQDHTSKSVSDVIQSYKAGAEVTIKLFRGGEVIEMPVVLGRRPAAADLLLLGRFGMRMSPEDEAAAEKAAREAYLQRWLARKKEAAK